MACVRWVGGGRGRAVRGSASRMGGRARDRASSGDPVGSRIDRRHGRDAREVSAHLGRSRRVQTLAQERRVGVRVAVERFVDQLDEEGLEVRLPGRGLLGHDDCHDDGTGPPEPGTGRLVATSGPARRRDQPAHRPPRPRDTFAMGSLGAVACQAPSRLPGAATCARPEGLRFKLVVRSTPHAPLALVPQRTARRASTPPSCGAMPPRRTRSGSAPAASSGTTTRFFQRHSNVYAYVPNIIGYARVLLAAAALRLALDDVPTSLALYALSFVCDELDGRFARMFDQCSEFGKLLDMVRGTDAFLPEPAGVVAHLPARARPDPGSLANPIVNSHPSLNPTPFPRRRR